MTSFLIITINSPNFIPIFVAFRCLITCYAIGFQLTRAHSIRTWLKITCVRVLALQMNGVAIANTPIVVDYWSLKDVHPRSLFFLTHMHAGRLCIQ